MENCEYCKRELTKNTKGVYVRRFINNLIVCAKCSGNYHRRGTFDSFRIEGVDYKEKCDFCEDNKRSSFKINGLFICNSCKRRYKYFGELRPKRIPMNPEERRQYIIKREKEKCALLKERRAYISTLSVDELLRLVRENGEEEE